MSDYGIPYAMSTQVLDAVPVAPMLVEQVYQRLRDAITDGSLPVSYTHLTLPTTPYV